VIVEVALSVALLIGAGLMTKSMVRLSRNELPFQSEALVAGRIGLHERDYPDRDGRQRFWDEVRRRAEAVPGVVATALAGAVPATGTNSEAIRLEGQSYPEPAERPTTHGEVVSPGYFEMLGVELLEGEGFHEGHTLETDRVAIVNRSFAHRFWPDGSALGRRFRTGVADTVPWLTVIGVVPDLRMEGFQPAGSPGANPDGFYVPAAQSDPSFLTLVVRSAAGRPDALGPALREAVRAVDPDVPLFDLRSVDAAIEQSSWFYSVFGSVFVAFGLAALFMASVGLYGVLSFSVSRRTQEMGIRMALGAESRQVIRLILRQGVMQLGIGLGAGLLLAGALSGVVGMLMFQVDPRDPTVFGGVVALIVLVGLVAGLVPALRATRVDPVVALRSE
jgi:predicted permease